MATGWWWTGWISTSDKARWSAYSALTAPGRPPSCTYADRAAAVVFAFDHDLVNRAKD